MALEDLVLVGLVGLRRGIREALCLRQESQTIAGGKGDNAISGAQTHEERNLRECEGGNARRDIPEILVLPGLVIVVRIGLHEGSRIRGKTYRIWVGIPVHELVGVVDEHALRLEISPRIQKMVGDRSQHSRPAWLRQY